MDLERTDEDLNQKIVSQFPGSKALRLLKRDSNKEKSDSPDFIKTKTVKIYFLNDNLPNDVLINKLFFRVELYSSSQTMLSVLALRTQQKLLQKRQVSLCTLRLGARGISSHFMSE